MNPQNTNQPFQSMPQPQGQGDMRAMPEPPMRQVQPIDVDQLGRDGQNALNGQNTMQGSVMANNPVMTNDQLATNGQIFQNGQVMPNGQVNGATTASLGATAMAANQAAPVSPNQEAPSSTQATLLISELRDNVVIMKDGSFRAVVACRSINYDLMSDVEREGIEYSYQNFLNSLRFTVQILVRSQRVDIGPYIEKLSEIRRNNDNMLLGVLMDDYINFIDVLSQEANIMDKSFFIVIPYYSSPDAEKVIQQTKNLFKSFSKSKSPVVTRIDRATYDKALTELSNRVDAVTSGLFQIGIHSTRLNTRELAELYYNFNNPDTAVREPLIDFNNIATMYVKKGEPDSNGNGGYNG